MPRIRIIQALIAVVTIAASAVLYFVMIPITVQNYGPLQSLLVAKPAVAGFASTPVFNGPLPTATSRFAAVLQASSVNPCGTGAYAVQWTGTSLRSLNDLQAQVNVVPTVATAKVAEQQIEAGNSSETYIKTLGSKKAPYTYDGAFAVPGLDAFGGAYTVPAQHIAAAARTASAPACMPRSMSRRTPDSPLSFGSAAATATLNIVGPKVTKAISIAPTDREAAVLKAGVGDIPPLQIVVDPFGSSLVFILVSLAIIVSLVLVPSAVVAVENRREAERLSRLDRHRRVRGSKALRRQRARFSSHAPLDLVASRTPSPDRTL